MAILLIYNHLRDAHPVQFCVCLIPRNAPHFFVSPTAIPVNRCLTEWILSVKTRHFTDKCIILNNLSVKPHPFTDKLSILSQPYSVIRIIVASRTASHRKKLNFMQTHRS